MTVKERLQQVVAEMTEDEAAEALVMAGVRAGATPVDLYGVGWGQVLADVDPSVLAVTGVPSIEIPDGIPRVR